MVARGRDADVSLCRVIRSPCDVLLARDGGAVPSTLDGHLEIGRVLNERIDGGEHHGRIGTLPHFAKGLVVGDQHGASLVAGADQFEQQGPFGLTLGDVGNIVRR